MRPSSIYCQGFRCALKPSLGAAVATARAGKEGLRPTLQNLYQTRAQGYKDALQAFIEGYREGYIGESTARMQRESQAIMQQAAQVEMAPQHWGPCAQSSGHVEPIHYLHSRRLDGRVILLQQLPVPLQPQHRAAMNTDSALGPPVAGKDCHPAQHST